MSHCAPRAFALASFLLSMVRPGIAQQVGGAGNRDLITVQQIAAAQANTAFEVVEKLRPEFLRRAERPQTVFGRTRASPVAAAGDASTGTGRMLARDRSAMDTDVDGTGGPLQISVFVNGARFGDARDLKRIAASDVLEIRFLSGIDAQQLLGAGNAGGVIQVTLRGS
jgi:hypothetical protein